MTYEINLNQKDKNTDENNLNDIMNSNQNTNRKTSGNYFNFSKDHENISYKYSNYISNDNIQKKNNISINQSIDTNKDSVNNRNNNIDINDIEKSLDKDKNTQDFNELPYHIAKTEDKRNMFKMFFSFFFIKAELIQIIFYPEDYSSRYILFSIYIVNLYIDLLMNSLLFNDYAVSQKYHNNGALDAITSLLISILSNIFTSIISYILKKLTNYPFTVGVIIKEIKNPTNYLSVTSRVLLLIKSKILILLVLEIIFGLFMIYYIFIFCVIYSKTVVSFLFNYMLSQIEGLIYSICLSVLISLLRRISIVYKIKKFYITSMYINDHF